MRFPLAWPIWQVALSSVLWTVLAYVVALGHSISNFAPVTAQGHTAIGLSVFMLSWPPWVTAAIWLPAIGFLLWRLLLPPRRQLP